jgi:hypothetical protein
MNHLQHLAPREQAEALLTMLFDPTDRVEIRRIGKPGAKKVFFDSWSEVIHEWPTIEAWNGDHHIYFGVCPRDGRTGTDDDVSVARCVFIDIDGTTDRAELDRRIEGLPEPSAVVFSGGGFHAYWMLDAPETDLNRWRQMMKALIRRCDADPSVHNPSRIMRLPGTRNIKQGRGDCVLLEHHPERVYPTGWIEALGLPEPQASIAATPDTGDEKWLQLTRTTLDWLNGDTIAPEGERNHQLFKAAAEMYGNRWGHDAIVEACTRAATRDGLEDAEIRQTIESAMSKPRTPSPNNSGERMAPEIGAASQVAAPVAAPVTTGDATPTATPPPAPRVKPPSHLLVRNFADIEREEIRWLWEGVIARGKLTMFAGDPGLGKSFLTCDLAARVSTGRDFPTGMINPNGPGRVLMLNCEDDAGDTIRARLDDAGADVAMVDWIDGAKVGEREQGFQIDAHLDLLEGHIAKHPETRLVTIDPVSAFGGDKDGDKNHDVRSLLRPLAEMAMRHGVAVVIVSHFNKSSGASKAYRTMGSIGWTAAVRMAWGFAADPDDESRRIMFPIKSNIAANAGGFAFSIGEDAHGGVALAWEHERVAVNADELLQPSTGGAMTDEMAEAVAFLQAELAHGGKRASEVRKAAKDAGITDSTLARAKKRAGAVSAKDGMNGGWRWMLAPKDASRENLSNFDSRCDSSGLDDFDDPEDVQGIPV